MKKSTCLAFETILIKDGVAQNLKYHQARFERTQSELFDIKKHIDLSLVITPPDDKLYRCKVVYGVNIESVDFVPYEKKEIKKLKIIESDIEYGHKRVDRTELDELFAQRANCDDVIIVKDSFVTDTTIANLAFFDGSKWLTPAIPLLEGAVRQRLLDEGFLTKTDIKAKDIKEYKKIAIMNALRGFEILTDDYSFKL